MKRINIIYRFFIVISLLSLCSCNDFLDETPDNRTALDSKDKVRDLLVSAYPLFNYRTVAELSSDNIMDNGKSQTHSIQFINDVAMWKTTSESSPFSDHFYALWSGYYGAISASNQALKAIKELGDTKDLQALKGEALITRAYNHFLLVNLFSKSYNKNTSSSDLGIPYITEPQTQLNLVKSRETVEKTYQKIGKDIQQALPLIKDSEYSVLKYHFNKDAVYAFATKFYVFYQKWAKAEKYATKVLGADPKSKLRDWQQITTVTQEPKFLGANFVGTDKIANLLLLSQSTGSSVIFGRYMWGTRFTHNRTIALYETAKAYCLWGRPNSKAWFKTKDETGGGLNKYIQHKIPYLQQTEDIVSGTAYIKSVNVAFTVDETLLYRAEARIAQNKLNEAMEDLNAFTQSYLKPTKNTYTLDEVNDFYNNEEYSEENILTVKKRLNPSFALASGSQENLMQYLLHTRRILMLHQGERWFDIRRYGIEVFRYVTNGSGKLFVDKLTKDDARKTFQLPQEVIQSGLQPNP